MNHSPLLVSRLLVIALVVSLSGCGDKPAKDTAAPKDKDAAPAKDAKDKKDASGTDAGVKDTGVKDKAGPKEESISLFDGKTLGKWKSTSFGGEGEVTVKDGQLIIAAGSPLSGVTWQGDPPAKINYEISLEAQRVEGSDFFLALTVPVKEDYISLVLGGWGGTVVGLSSLDGQDASENEYTKYQNFKMGQWYKVRMVVKEKQIQVFIDGETIIDATLADRKITTRIEVDLSKPLGIATYSTMGAYRNVVLKKL